MYAAQTRATAIRDTWSEASILRSMLGTRGRPWAMPGGCTMEIPTVVPRRSMDFRATRDGHPNHFRFRTMTTSWELRALVMGYPTCAPYVPQWGSRPVVVVLVVILVNYTVCLCLTITH